MTVQHLGSVPSYVAQTIATEVRLERAFGTNQTLIALTVQQVLERLIEHVGCGVFRWRDFPTRDQFEPVPTPATGQRTDQDARRTA